MRLDQAGARILAAAVTALPTAPARRYVTMGPPVWDCEQLVVYFLRGFNGSHGHEDSSRVAPCPIRLSATFGVELIRCAPVADAYGNPESSTMLNDAGIALLTELDSLWRGLNTAAKTMAGEEGVYAAVNPLEPSEADGAFWGGHISVSMETL